MVWKRKIHQLKLRWEAAITYCTVERLVLEMTCIKLNSTQITHSTLDNESTFVSDRKTSLEQNGLTYCILQ